MAVPQTRDQFEALTNLEAMLRVVFYDQLTAIADPNQEILQFYNRQTSSDAIERSQGVGGYGDVPKYTGTLNYDDFELLFQKGYTHEQYANGIAIERELIDDEKYGVMAQRTAQFGLSYDRTIYKHAASVFNNAFSAATDESTGGDEKALCATDHPLKPGSSDVQSNKGTDALSYDTVVATQEAMMEFTDSEENPIMVVPDTLLVPVTLYNEALVITGSELRPGVANNDINTQTGLRPVVSKYLTDSNNWFLIDWRLASTVYLNWYTRVAPEFVMDPTSDFNLVAKFRGYMRHSYGFDHWPWIYGHEVA